MSVHRAPVTSSTIVVAVDVGKTSAVLSATDSARSTCVRPVEFAMTRSGLVGVVRRVGAVISACAQVKVGIQAAGHYHRPVLDYRWPAGWEVLEFNPAHVAEQRRVQGRRRVKTDAIDLEAITELLLAGRGRLITDREVLIGEVAAWAIHRSRRVATRSATKNQTARSTRPRVSGVDAGVARCAGHQDRSASRRRVRRPGPAVRAGCNQADPVRHRPRYSAAPWHR